MSLAEKLKEQGLSFDQTDSGLLRGGFQLESGRKQFFFLDPEADDHVGYQEHDFTSIVGPADDPANLRAACEMAGKSKRGAIVDLETEAGRVDLLKGMRKALSLRAGFWDWMHLRAQTLGECDSGVTASFEK